jgi:hypothetical protein
MAKEEEEAVEVAADPAAVEAAADPELKLRMEDHRMEDHLMEAHRIENPGATAM